MLQMKALSETQQALRQACVFCSSHDQKESDEKNEKAPVHSFVYQVRVARTRDQHDGRPHGGDQSRRKTGEKSGQNQNGYQTCLDKGCAVNLHRIGESFGSDIVNAPPEVQPPKYEPIQKQADERNRTQVPQE